MSITVSFTTYSKRENSTKQLTMTATHECNLKNGCSMLSPTLLLELQTNTFPQYTEFKIEDRYYKVNDIRSVRNNLFEVSGEVDVLATYKANILSTTAYVLYDSVTNTELVDNRLPMKTSKSVQATTAPCPFTVDGGCYILSLTGSKDSTGIYKVTFGELSDLIDDVDNVMNNIFDFDPEPTPPTSGNPYDAIKYCAEYISWTVSCLKLPFAQFFGSGNIPENIRECKFIPFNVGTTYPRPTDPDTGETIPVYLGTFKTKQALSKLATETVHRETTVSIPWQSADYRRRSPYTEIYLYLPYIGMTKISSENLVGQSSITVKYDLSMKDGTMICTISSGSEIIGQYNTNVAAAVPIGFSNINIPKAAQSVIATVAAIKSDSIAKAGLGALSFGDAVTPYYSCIGGLDGVAATATNQNITCYTIFHDTIVAPNTELQTIGSPTMSPKSLASLTGYVQTMSASVDGAMTTDERTKLNEFLDSGIFIE